MRPLLPRLRRHLSYANVMSSIACIAALTTGSAFAVTQLTGANIKNGSITSADIRNGSLTGADLKNGSVLSADVAGLNGSDVVNGTLTGTDLAADTVAGNNIRNGGIGGLDIAVDAITGDHIGNEAVGSEQVADGTIDLTDLTGSTVDTLSISDFDGALCPLAVGQGSIATTLTSSGLVTSLCQSPQTPDSFEPNDTQETAAVGPVVDVGGVNGRIYDATFTSKTEVDWYAWPATDLAGTPFGVGIGEVPGAGFVPARDVYKNGTLVQSFPTGNNSGFQDASATNTDTYTVKVTANAKYSYQLSMGASCGCL